MKCTEILNTPGALRVVVCLKMAKKHVRHRNPTKGLPRESSDQLAGKQSIHDSSHRRHESPNFTNWVRVVVLALVLLLTAAFIGLILARGSFIHSYLFAKYEPPTNEKPETEVPDQYNEQDPEKLAPNEKTTEIKARPNSRASNTVRTEGTQVASQSAADTNNQNVDNQNVDNQNVDNQDTDNQNVDNQDIDRQNVDNQGADNQNVDNQDTDRQNVDNQNVDKEDIDKDVDNQGADNKEVDNQNEDVDSQNLDSKDVDNQKVDSKDVHDQRADRQEYFQETLLKKMRIHDIRVNGRTVRGEEIVGNKRRPDQASTRVYKFEHFLSDEECDALMRVHLRHISQYSNDPILCFDSVHTLRKHLRGSKIGNVKVSSKDFTEGTTCVNSSFSRKLKSILGWSFSTAFYPGENRFSSVFDRQVYEATGFKSLNGGKYQITSYKTGIGYKSHTDCTIGNMDLRDRMGTILVYLQDVAEGGQTEFPELGISVRPRKGRAITWNNQDVNGVCDPYSLHVARPVIDGHKIILQRWYYHKNFYMLGKRPMEPDLPPRSALQPLVSCDEYDHGSCRWYDEWNYNHLNEYRHAMHQL